ncbi:response regulator [Pseudomonas sp. SWI7]|jgi:DNA-binding NtrC family response regulator|uniref:response regulator n=1 Tax=Pseudomonas sp. SWI7 TaxID=2587597 RepID=UPI00111E22B6|nr:response regulator [Pseudomonas sp. SWI7]MDP9666345.1 DNA-binding NtrC family response regulator [Pseudomonas cremoricolorata]QDC04678.1 response regulator [Pseudomonas sp. SWI7]
MNSNNSPLIQAVLVVEDEPAIREMLANMLEDFPVAITSVATADEGFLELYRQPWALLITDVQTPGRTNGIELASAARKHQPEIEVIVMSGYHNALGLPLPPNVSFLAKPWSLDDLYALVEVYLAK